MSADFVSHCLELLSPAGAARARRMFGGHGLYVDDLFVAILIHERLYLKADALSRPQFEAAHCEPFTYAGRQDQVLVMSYFTAPDEAMESPDAMRPWARLAIDAALRARVAQAAKPARRPAVKKAAKVASQRAAVPARKGTKAV